jgi:hypothetical protein
VTFLRRNLLALAKLDAAVAAPPAASELATMPPASSLHLAAAETEAQAVSVELHVGCSVVVNGLQARPDLNGCRCKT